MPNLTMRIDDDFLAMARKGAEDSGFRTVTGFFRFAVHRLLKEGSKWSDAEMKTFAQQWAGRKGNPPGVLEEMDKQMEREFKQFKKDFLTNK